MLFILGIPWIFESVHFFMHREYEHCHPDSVTELVFGFFGNINYCRGVFLFICFVCKETVFVKVKKVKTVRWISQLCSQGPVETEDFQIKSCRGGTFRTNLSV